MTKKIISMLMAFTLITTCLTTQVFAATSTENEIMPLYNYTISTSSSLSIKSKTASCGSVVVGMSGVTTKIVFTQKLQQKVSGSWTTIKTWTTTKNQVSASFINTKSSLSSGTYRTKTSAKVYSGSSYETVTSTSATVTC